MLHQNLEFSGFRQPYISNKNVLTLKLSYITLELISKVSTHLKPKSVIINCRKIRKH